MGALGAAGCGYPEVTHLTTTVDVDDPDEVVDLVIDRMLELTIDEGIPVYVIPIRTPERVATLRQEERTRRHPPAVPIFLPPAPPRTRPTCPCPQVVVGPGDGKALGRNAVVDVTIRRARAIAVHIPCACRPHQDAASTWTAGRRREIEGACLCCT